MHGDNQHLEAQPVAGRNIGRDGVRKSRGRGLRTKNGCATCRSRHLKCDETKPICQNCMRKNKTCCYADAASEPAARSTSSPPRSLNSSRVQHDDDAGNASYEAFSQNTHLSEAQGDANYVAAAAVYEEPGEQHAINFTSPESIGTRSLHQPIGVATARWFDMLVQDANLELGPVNHTQISTSGTDSQHAGLDTRHSPLLHVHGVDTTDPPLPTIVTQDVSEGQSDDQGRNCPWRSEAPLNLAQHELFLLAEFTTHISRWMDLFDPLTHFSTLVPRLAIHNVGLMNAILALSARHHSVALESSAEERSYAQEESIRFYHECLHYVRIAMQHTSYHTSDELLVTTLIVSAYEMLDGSPQDWQRHLQGVFWIQRSQVIHGDSGGLRGAVWLAWLCQDIWAAFRGKRKVFTFWKPVKSFRELDPAQLAGRAAFLLAKVIDYCFREDRPHDLSAAILVNLQQAQTLTSMLDNWERCLTPHFMPLPYYDTQQSPIFKPVWIHPPMFASAIQLYHTARLLLRLHQPSLGGFHEGTRRQISLDSSVGTICGIALTLTHYGSSITSSMCLFIAGLCTTDQQRREEIIRLLERCRYRTGWPVRSLGDDLVTFWQEPNDDTPFATSLSS